MYEYTAAHLAATNTNIVAALAITLKKYTYSYSNGMPACMGT